MSLRWLFIDIGGPILDDGPLFDYLAAALRGILVAQGNRITGKMFQEAMQRGWREGAPSTLDYLIRYFISEEDKYNQAKNAYWDILQGLTWDEYRRLQVLRPDVAPALEAFSSHYQLATVSNNIIRVKELLEELDVAHFFSIWGLSEEVGYTKPDPQLFWHVIRQAGCRPAEAMMVGDRLDNDILPAQKLGLATAQIMLEHTFGAPPAHMLDVKPDFRVSSLWELAQKLVPDAALEMSNETPRMQRSSS